MLFCSVILACTPPALVANGTYVLQQDNNFTDSLKLWVDGANNSSSESKHSIKYLQKIYDSQSGTLLKTNSGTWRITGSKIVLKNYCPLAPTLEIVPSMTADIENGKIILSPTVQYLKVQ